MGKIQIDHTGSGGGITLSSDGTSLLVNGVAPGGAGSINELSDGYTDETNFALGNYGTALANIDPTAGFRNLGIGSAALNQTTTGADNVAIGYRSACSNTIAGCNIAIGTCSLRLNTTASCNIAIGTFSVCSLNGGFGANIGIGTSALAALTTGTANVAIGHQSMINAEGCTKWNTAVGYQTLRTVGQKSGNVAVGMWALCNATTGSSNTGLGCRALQNVTTGYGNVGIGIGNGAITTGGSNVAIGNNAANSCTAGDFNIAIGFNANSRMMPLSCNNIAIGSYAFGCEWSGYGGCNVAIGYQTMRWRCGDESNDNIGIGQYALYCAAFSNRQIGIGDSALRYSKTGSANVAVGAYSLASSDTATSSFSNNTALGYFSGSCIIGGENVIIGTQTAQTPTPVNNNQNTIIGYRSFYGQCGNCNTVMGHRALGGCLANGVSGLANANVSIGRCSLSLMSTGNSNVAVGTNAMACANNVSQRIAIGNNAAGGATTPGTELIAIGSYAAGLNTGTSNIAIGQSTLGGSIIYSSSGGYNVAVGHQSQSRMTNGCFNISMGYYSMAGNSNGGGGGFNIGIGYCALHNICSGDDNNTAVGHYALKTASGVTESVAVGVNALQNTTTGDNNTALGFSAGTANTSGYRNVFIGACAGCSNTTQFFNVAIGAGADLSGAVAGIAIGKDATVTGTGGIAIGWLESSAACEIRVGGCTGITYTIGCTGGTNKKTTSTATSVTLNPKTHNAYHVTTSGNTTFTLTAPGSSDVITSFTVIVTAGGAHTLSWPASVKWAGGTAPDAPASGETDVYTLMTVDNGTTWYGFLAGDAMA